jgi:outer membrane usher protein
MTGQYEYASEYNGFSFSYQGAVVFLDRKLALTRYVDNAFALVKINDYQDIEVYRSLSPIGKTDKDSNVWVPDIIPYVRTDISFNLDQLDMDDKVEYESKQMVGLNKRGYIINFPVYRTKKIIAHLVNSKGEKFVQGSEVYINQNNDIFYPIDAEGNVYLYGLVSGEYSIFVKTAGGESCKSKLNIQVEQVEKNVENIIELICK